VVGGADMDGEGRVVPSISIDAFGDDERIGPAARDRRVMARVSHNVAGWIVE